MHKWVNFGWLLKKWQSFKIPLKYCKPQLTPYFVKKTKHFSSTHLIFPQRNLRILIVGEYLNIVSSRESNWKLPFLNSKTGAYIQAMQFAGKSKTQNGKSKVVYDKINDRVLYVMAAIRIFLSRQIRLMESLMKEKKKSNKKTTPCLMIWYIEVAMCSNMSKPLEYNYKNWKH